MGERDEHTVAPATTGAGGTALVVDAEALFRFGVVTALRALGVEGRETAFGREAVKLASEGRIELVVVGTPSDMPRVELARRLREPDRRPRLLVLLPLVDYDEVGGLLALEVDGLLPRAVAPDALVRTIGQARAGVRVVDPGLLRPPAPTGDGAAGPPALALTARERDVLSLLADGRSNRDIAATLFVSLPTVKTHLAHIYAKLDARNRNEALGRAVALGLLA